MVWDFCEIGACRRCATGGFASALRLDRAMSSKHGLARSRGQVQRADAAEHPLPDETAAVWFTDPPYYDAIPYADLSDFFFVWLKRALPGHPLLRDPFDPTNPLTPKAREIVRGSST